MAEPGSNQSRTWIWVLLVLLSVVGLGYFAFHSTRDKVTVTSARVERGPIVRTIPTNGRVEPLVDFQAHAPSASTVQRIDVHLGQSVKRGQPLLQLNVKDAQARVASAQAQLRIDTQGRRTLQAQGTRDELLGENADLKTAEMQLKDAQTSLGALQSLQARGAASANEVAAAQQTVTADQLRVNQLQTRLTGRFGPGEFADNSAQLARDQQELAAAQDNLAQMNVHSAIAGTVYSLPVARFDYVQPGQALISVADLHKLQVRAFFDEPLIGSLAPGQPVAIQWDARLDHTWHGRVVQAPTTVINVGTRNVGECLISVDDADGDLLPNINVTVTVTTMQHSDVLTLPREALHTEGMENFVYRIIDGKLVRTPVSVGVVNLTRVEITGGLAKGDLVALTATTDVDLQPGLAVRTQPQQPEQQPQQ